MLPATNAHAIRSATPDDLEDVVTLCGEHAVYERAVWTAAGKADRLAAALFAERPRLWCLVATVEGAIVGYATYTRDYSTWRAADFVYLDCLFVREAHRGFGIGAHLMAAVSDAARALECPVIEWQTPAWNVDAARFYERLGGVGSDKRRFLWEPQ